MSLSSARGKCLRFCYRLCVAVVHVAVFYSDRFLKQRLIQLYLLKKV